MPLKFPNARLFIHDLLAKHELSGPEAIVKAASEFKIIDAGSVEEIKVVDDGSRCQCMAAARNVVDKHFRDNTRNPDLPEVNVNEVWSAIEREAEAYKQTSSLNPKKCDSGIKSHDCASFAPAIFDLVLQQIRRYP